MAPHSSIVARKIPWMEEGMELLGQKIQALKVLKRLPSIKAKPVHAHQQGKRVSISSNSF